jgi:hypothetical protein
MEENGWKLQGFRHHKSRILQKMSMRRPGLSLNNQRQISKWVLWEGSVRHRAVSRRWYRSSSRANSSCRYWVSSRSKPSRRLATSIWIYSTGRSWCGCWILPTGSSTASRVNSQRYALCNSSTGLVSKYRPLSSETTPRVCTSASKKTRSIGYQEGR